MGWQERCSTCVGMERMACERGRALAEAGKSRISICIPTYNRRNSIARLLDSLCPAVATFALGCVEVCVSDNGSSDGAWDVLQDYAGIHSFLKIRRNEQNQGFGRNLWQTVAMASGEYVYLTGDDDRIEKQGVRTLLEHTGVGGGGLIIFNSHPVPSMSAVCRAATEPVELESLEDYINKLGLFHASFIGNLCFCRSVFLENAPPGKYVHQSAYPHLFPVFRTLRTSQTRFVNAPISEPDDSSRGWRGMQPIYTSVDMARIVRQEIAPYVKAQTSRRLLLRLARSLPRACLRTLKKEIRPDRSNPFESLHFSNLAEIYFDLKGPFSDTDQTGRYRGHAAG